MELPQLGPILDQDASLLDAIIKMTDPKLVIEFGYFWGKSASVMLNAMSSDARLISYDNTKNPSVADTRFEFKRLSQEEFEPVDGVDFVFLDASHDFELNKITFEKLLPCLSHRAIIAVHDTGTWPGNVFNAQAGYDLDDNEYIHCPGERIFVNWISENYPDFQQIHLHSFPKIGHGITLLQNKFNLRV